jgi:hypothetical protein
VSRIVEKKVIDVVTGVLARMLILEQFRLIKLALSLWNCGTRVFVAQNARASFFKPCHMTLFLLSIIMRF